MLNKDILISLLLTTLILTGCVIIYKSTGIDIDNELKLKTEKHIIHSREKTINIDTGSSEVMEDDDGE